MMVLLSLLSLSNFLFHSSICSSLVSASLSLSLSLCHLASTCLWSKAHSSDCPRSHIFIPARHTLHSSYTLTLTLHTIQGLQATYSICICLLGPLLVQFNSLSHLVLSFYICLLPFLFNFHILFIYMHFILILSILFSCISYHIYVCNLYVHLLYDSIHCHLKV